MDIIKILMCMLVLCISHMDAKEANCPSNTVEIVFTKHGIICATTSFVPELSHLSVDPKALPKLMDNYPLIYKTASSPVITQSFVNNQLIPHQLKQVSAPLLYPHVQPVLPEHIAPPLPIYHENIISQNNDVNDQIDRRPDLIDEKRIEYRNMLWAKLMRETLAKRQLRYYNNNYNDLFVNKIFANTDNENNNELQNQNSGEQQKSLEQNQPNSYSQQNDYNIDKQIANPEAIQTTASQQSDSLPNTYDKFAEESPKEQTSETSDTDRDKTADETEETMTAMENKDNKQLLKEYLNYLQNNKRETVQTRDEMKNKGEIVVDLQTNKINTHRQIPEIIRGFIPSTDTIFKGYSGLHAKKESSYDQDPMAGGDDSMFSESQVNYQFAVAENPYSRYSNKKSINNFGLSHPNHNYNNNHNFRVVGSEMTLGTDSRQPSKGYGYGYKSYTNDQDDKLRHNLHPYMHHMNRPRGILTNEDDVVLVTADPRQRQWIEMLEAQQQQKREHSLQDYIKNPNHINFDPMDSQPSTQWNPNNYMKSNAVHMKKRFHIDNNRIDYNGWTPVGRSRRDNTDSDIRTSSTKTTSQSDIQPFRGLAAHKKNNIHKRGQAELC